MKRFKQFDILRIWLTFSVVTLHVLAMGVLNYPVDSLKSYLIVFANRFFIFTVPGFVFLSGAMIHLQYKTNGRDFKPLKFYISKLKYIILPYSVATLVYHFVIQRMSGLPFSFEGFLEKLIFGSGQYHLYFIPIIMQFFLLVPLYIGLVRNDWVYKNRMYVMLGIFLINAYALTEVSFQYSDRFFLNYSFFFSFGVLYGETLIEWVKKKYVIISSIVMIGILWGLNTKFYYSIIYYNDYGYSDLMNYGWYITSIVMIFVGLFFSDWIIGKRIEKIFLASFSESSFYFYLIHPLVLSVAFTSLVFIDTFLYKLLMTYGITLVVSAILSIIAKKVERLVL